MVTAFGSQLILAREGSRGGVKYVTVNGSLMNNKGEKDAMVRTKEGHKCVMKMQVTDVVVQTVESIDQAKVFKAHAVRQGLCANLIDALKFLANQQEDGDGLIQNIVANLGEGSRASRKG